MKWVALLLFILVGIGATVAVRQNPRAVLVAAFLLGFLPFVMAPWHLVIAPYSIASWPGYVKGWEIGLIDALAVACLIGIPKARTQLPFKYVFLLYIASAAVSVFLAPNFTIALSYPIQLARVFLVFAAIARISASPLGVKAVLQGLFAGLAYQAFVAIWAKFGGAVQTGGSFGHQNTLGFASHMVFIPAFGLLLSGRWTRWAVLGLICGTLVIILTASRATLVFAAIGLTITYFLSATSQWSTRKALVGLASIMAVGLSVPVIQASFAQRFELRGGSFGDEDQERAAFNRAARMLIADAPFGVGANHYVVIVNTKGYSQRAGVAWNGGSRATNVHNSYLLIWAETGFFGIISLAFLLITPMIASFTCAFRFRRSFQSDLLIGIGGAFCAVILHSFYEWVLVTYHIQYVFAVALGMSAGLIMQLRTGAASGGRSVPIENAIAPLSSLQKVGRQSITR